MCKIIIKKIITEYDHTITYCDTYGCEKRGCIVEIENE